MTHAQGRLATVADLIEIAGRLSPSTAIVPGGHRVEDLRLVESARDHGIVDRIVLVGQRDRIAAAVAEARIEVAPDDIVAVEGDEQIAAATVELIRSGGVDIVLKGDISTPVINRHMLPLAIRPTVSLATVFDAAPLAGGRPMLLTDAGVTTVCNFGRMVGLVRNAIDVAQAVMEIDRPRVAILSANEKQVPSLPSTRIGLELARLHWPDAVVCGPLSLDLAIDPESVAIKRMPDLPNAEEVAGRADILVCPGIDTANVLYKLVSALNKYGEASLASITVGFPVPYIILSRSDSLETRLASIALCTVYARRRPQGQTSAARAAPMPAAEGYRVLAVGPGPTATEAAVYENDRCLAAFEVSGELPASAAPGDCHAAAESLAQAVVGALQHSGGHRIDAVAVRGGHYAAAIAESLAEKLDAPSVVVAPAAPGEPDKSETGGENVWTNGTETASVEMLAAAGSLGVEEATRRAAEAVGLPVEDVSLVVAQLDRRMTVAAVRGGKILELTEAGEATCYLGDEPIDRIERRVADGDRHARRAVDALAHRVAKEIGKAFVAAGCEVEAIVLAGKLAGSSLVRNALRRVNRLAPLVVLEGSLEMAALAAAAVKRLAGLPDKPFPDHRSKKSGELPDE